jgi:hypothetical protein
MAIRSSKMQRSTIRRRHIETGAGYFARFGPPHTPRNLELGKRVTMMLAGQSAGFDSNLVTHWLSEFAAHAQMEAPRRQTP